MIVKLVPFVAAFLYLVGGQWWKAGRWLMGIPIFIMALISGYPWYSIFAVLTYLIATNVFSYGEDMPQTKWFGKWVSMGLSGLTFGLASIVVLGTTLGIIQCVIGLVAFLILKYLDDADKLKNPWQELARGFLGTIVFFIA